MKDVGWTINKAFKEEEFGIDFTGLFDEIGKVRARQKAAGMHDPDCPQKQIPRRRYSPPSMPIFDMPLTIKSSDDAGAYSKYLERHFQELDRELNKWRVSCREYEAEWDQHVAARIECSCWLTTEWEDSE